VIGHLEAQHLKKDTINYSVFFVKKATFLAKASLKKINIDQEPSCGSLSPVRVSIVRGTQEQR
jgi:hypothetical protein